MSSAARPPLIQLARVSKSYFTPKGVIQAIQEISLTVQPGEFIALLGPSGCGKSTLLNLVAALDRPTRGGVLFDGWERKEPDQAVAVIFQEPALFPWRTVKGNVTIALEALRVDRKEAELLARQATAAVGLAPFLDIYPSQLSGGMKQRLMLARALAVGAPVVLMDEPFGALDAITREQMQELVLQLYAARRFTTILVTHSLEEALYMAQRVIVMSSRPARIIREVIIDEPYPRGYDFRVSARLASLRQELHQILRDERDSTNHDIRSIPAGLGVSEKSHAS